MIGYSIFYGELMSRLKGRTMNSTTHEREAEFVDFNGNLNDSALVLPYLLSSLLRAQQKITGAELVGQMAVPLLDKFGVKDETDWEEALLDQEKGAFSELAVGESLHLLDAYAFFGIDYSGEAGRSIEEIARLRQADLDRVAPLADLLPILHAEPDLEKRSAHGEAFFLKMLAAARCRIALDLGDRVPVAGLTVLAQISDSRMRNIAKRSDDAILPVGEDRMVANDRARAWLHDQTEFLATLAADEEAADAEITDPIFVPVAADGTRFDVTLRHGGGYQVGPKGAELTFPDYDSALEALTRMPVACWRRPSEGSGRRGIVRATHWERISRTNILFRES